MDGLMNLSSITGIASSYPLAALLRLWNADQLG